MAFDTSFAAMQLFCEARAGGLWRGLLSATQVLLIPLRHLFPHPRGVRHGCLPWSWGGQGFRVGRVRVHTAPKGDLVHMGCQQAQACLIQGRGEGGSLVCRAPDRQYLLFAHARVRPPASTQALAGALEVCTLLFGFPLIMLWVWAGAS